jgi:hypothetical protein
MTTEQGSPEEATAEVKRNGGSRISLDAWAVALALVLSFLIWIGVIKHIPW